MQQFGLAISSAIASVLCSKSGTIDRTEFYQSVDEKNSEFGDAIFALIGALTIASVRVDSTGDDDDVCVFADLLDEDNSGVLDFSEYVDALGKFCILSKEEVLKCMSPSSLWEGDE